jgi:hypothetical protein
MNSMNKSKVNTIAGGIVGVVAAVLLSGPAFAQSRQMNMNDCSKILPAGQAGCAADNVMRTECNKTSNPMQCYTNKKNAASTPAATTKQPAPAPAPAVAKPAAPAPAPAPVAAKPAAPAPAPAPVAAKPADPNIVTSVPQGARNCATDGKKCLVAGTWTGVYGANGTFAKISGTGDFVCDPKTFKIADPVPKVLKTCWVIGAAPAPAAKAPAAAAQPKMIALPLSCKGSLKDNPVKTFTSRADFDKAGYSAPVVMAATSLQGATDECRTSCANTGEPAPCGWYTLVKWREDTSANGRSRMVYTCYKVGARNYKDAFKPKMAADKNFGDSSNALYFSESYTYPCAR